MKCRMSDLNDNSSSGLNVISIFSDAILTIYIMLPFEIIYRAYIIITVIWFDCNMKLQN